MCRQRGGAGGLCRQSIQLRQATLPHAGVEGGRVCRCVPQRYRHVICVRAPAPPHLDLLPAGNHCGRSPNGGGSVVMPEW